MNNKLEMEQKLSKVTDDRYRLRYHLMPPVGWMNDPNGLIYYKGEYHAFYQHYPYEPKQGPMHWGHAKTKDLVHWEHLPIALTPSMPYDYSDRPGHGCWSGSAVDNEGVLSLLYTGHVDGRDPVEVQSLAISTDGVTFKKYEHNPVIDNAPDEQYFGFRDPKVWKHNNLWYMLLGYGKDGIGKAIMYRSPNLTDWEYMGPAAESDGTMGDMWECPDMFPLGDEHESHVLIFSPMNIAPIKTLYWSGTFDYDQMHFKRDHVERIDYGFDFYAPQTLIDNQGRRIMLAWMNIWGAKMPETEDGWQGALTLPRELKLAEDGTLRALPVPELRELRGKHHSFNDVNLIADELMNLSTVQGDALEIIMIFNVKEAAEDSRFGIRVRSAMDDTEYTEITYSMKESKLLMDRNHSGAGDGGVSEAPLQPLEDGRVKLHLFVDRSSVELFANDGIKTITNRIYPNTSSVAVKLFSSVTDVMLEKLDIWELKDVVSLKGGN